MKWTISPGERSSIRLATEFHLLLAEMTGSPVLARYVAELGYRCALILSLYSRPHSSDCAVSEHREIVAAIIARDAGGAERVAREHIRQALRTRLRMLRAV